MKHQYLATMNKKEFYLYKTRRTKLQDQREICEDYVFKNYLTTSEQKYFTKD